MHALRWMNDRQTDGVPCGTRAGVGVRLRGAVLPRSWERAQRTADACGQRSADK